MTTAAVARFDARSYSVLSRMGEIGFDVHVLQGRREWGGPRREPLSSYLHATFARFRRDGWQCEVRVCTCLAWRKTGGRVASYPLAWEEMAPPEERLVARLAGTASDRVVACIETELAAGDAVRLFMFNADADLCFEEILAPREGR